jgi:hypothetical protein
LQTPHPFANNAFFLMVGVAQLVEHLVVAQVAVGSSPITHPIGIQRPLQLFVAAAFLPLNFLPQTHTDKMPLWITQKRNKRQIAYPARMY